MDTQERQFDILEQVIDEYRVYDFPITSNLVNELLLLFRQSLIGDRRSRVSKETIPYKLYYDTHIANSLTDAVLDDNIISKFQVSEFVVLCLFRHRSDSSIMEQALAMLNAYVAKYLPEYKVSAPFGLFGRFSFGFTIHGSNLEMVISLYYWILNWLTTQDGCSVYDSVKLMLVNWDISQLAKSDTIIGNSIDPCNRAPCAIILVKYNMKEVENTKLATQGVTQGLLKIDWGVSKAVHIYGGISWHELVVFVYDCGIDHLAKIAWDIRKISPVSETSTLITCPYDDSRMQGVDKCGDVKLLAMSKYSNGVDPAIYHRGLREGEYYIYGHADHLAEFYVNNIHDARRVIASHDAREDLDIESVMILTHGGCDAGGNQILDKGRTSNLTHSCQYDNNAIDSACIDPDCSVAKLMYVYATKVKCMLPRTGPIFGIDRRIVKSLEGIAKAYNDGKISEECAMFALSEIQAAISQRLAGPSVAAGNQIMGGIGEQHGGHNVILLACETLFNLVMRYIVAKELKEVQPRDVPSLCLIRFTSPFSGMPRLSMRRYAKELGSIMYSGDIPVFIHLPGLKYQPWNWALSLSLLQPWLDAQTYPDLRGEDSDFGNIFGRKSTIVTSILRDDIHNHLLRESSGELKYVFDNSGLPIEIVMRQSISFAPDAIQSNEARCEYWGVSEAGMAKLEGGYRCAMQSGCVILDELDSGEKIAAFANAYCSLQRNEAASARAFSSFVLTLYRQHTQFVKE